MIASDELCAYHSVSYGDDWARCNRMMCDFIHRGIVASAVPGLAGDSLERDVHDLEAALSA
jgi:hypothetical protein